MAKTRLVVLGAVTLSGILLNGKMHAESSRPADASVAEKLLQLPRPLVIAHRGYSRFAPENTIPSFQLGNLAGADLVELDYQITKDGVPVVIHDHELDRTTDATNRTGRAHVRVAETTSAELERLDAGSWFGRQYAGTRIPSLAQAIESISKSGVTLIERKAGSARELWDVLRRGELVNRVVVQSFDWRFLSEFHALAPSQIVGALGPPSSLADGTEPRKEDKQLSGAYLEAVVKLGANVVVWSKEISSEAVSAAHAKGLKVWVYTIDEPELANRLLDMGVDGLITNNTSLIWRAIALRALTQRR